MTSASSLSAEHERPYIGVCVRAGVATIATLCGQHVKITTLRLDRRVRDRRCGALQALVKAQVPDRFQATVIAEPGTTLLRNLQGHVAGLLSLSIKRAMERLGHGEVATRRALYASIVSFLPQLDGHVRVLADRQELACSEPRMRATPLAVVLALAGQRIAIALASSLSNNQTYDKEIRSYSQRLARYRELETNHQRRKVESASRRPRVAQYA